MSRDRRRQDKPATERRSLPRTTRAQATATADPEAGSALVSPQRRNFVFLAIVLGMLLAALDQTIVATALPTIVADLGGAGHQSWVVTSYLLASTFITALVGRLGDLFGRKVILQAAIFLFLLGSALCGLSQSMRQLIGFRVLQGLGGGGLMVTIMAVIGDIFTPRERGRYQGIFGGIFGLSTVLGPLLRFFRRAPELALDILYQSAAWPLRVNCRRTSVHRAKRASSSRH